MKGGEGLFAAAAIRIMPALRGVLAHSRENKHEDILKKSFWRDKFRFLMQHDHILFQELKIKFGDVESRHAGRLGGNTLNDQPY